MKRLKDYIRKKVRALFGYNEIMSMLQQEQAARKVFMKTFQKECMAAIKEKLNNRTDSADVLEYLRKNVPSAENRVIEDLREKISSIENKVIQNQVLSRWKIIDAMDRVLFPEDFQVTCGICGHSAAKNTYKTVVANCKFSGGKLERFICPKCGCIFGPLKMQMLSPQELAEEYQVCYQTYTWNISAHEIMTAESVVTDKNKIYLNYGSGSSLEAGSAGIMRKRGYDVYAYEPYAKIAKVPNWVITTKEQLQSMKFDAIYSNDLIEHLADPIAEIKFMKSLLKDGNSFMEHSTSCYEYRQEYTRFHLFFFTGNSLDHICRECGLSAELVANEEREPRHQYISYRFSMTGR